MAAVSTSSIDGAWPSDGLERVGYCPVCRSGSRETLHRGLRDWTFMSAPGEWTLHRCVQCGSAYLDPRPNRDSVHLAYANYYTHAEPTPRVGIAARLPRWAKGPYLMARERLSKIASLAENRRESGGFSIPMPREGARLLDVGCGRGDFLVHAKARGWAAIGIDTDATAVKVARARNLTAHHAVLETIPAGLGDFDVITLNHVIEHMHDPISALRTCHRLLRVGGSLWIETPNIESQGHRIFGVSWRGLEVPRHLVIFSRRSLARALEEAGFRDVQDGPYQPLCEQIFSQSARIDALRATSTMCDARAAERVAKAQPEAREFATVIAYKPA